LITRDDIFTVELTEKMILDAVHYAEKSLHYTFNRMGSGNLYDRVRNIVKGLIMEAAFKRLLDVHQVKYDLLGNTHWTKKDRYDVGLNGHKYDIKGFFINDQWRVTEILKDPGWLLDCSALVPSDQVNAKSLKDDDVYVFPFMIGEVERTNDPDLFTLNRFRYLVHLFWDYAWIKNADWKSLGSLRIQSKTQSELKLRIGGQGANQEIVIEEIILQPKAEVITRNEFFTVLFAQVSGIPSTDVTISCAANKKSESITRRDWGNIWVYNSVVYFTGYMRKGDFRQRSVEIPRYYKKCKQYGETKTVNRMLPIIELNPLSHILPPNFQRFIPADKG
jgi:hypothetical protein